MLLKLENIFKYFKIGGERKSVLNGLNLKIDKGEIISITGKSGCGKTTLLNIIAGIISKDRGNFYFNDKKIIFPFDILSSRRRNREMGFIYQTFRLLPDESVMTNVLLPARIRGYVGRDTKKYADEILHKLGIHEFRKSKVAFLSGGQKQRVAIARALVNRPSLILADEPTANLDRQTSKEIFDILISLKKENKSILIITHKEYMHKKSDCLYVMGKGKLRKRKVK
ncbi:ABC transporter ATP-binding protein [Spirochaetota bacterium]